MAQDSLWQEQSRNTLADPSVPFHEHWSLWQSVFADRPPEAGPPIAWSPDPDADADSNLAAFMRDRGIGNFASLHEWSVADRAAFWQTTLDRLGIAFQTTPEAILEGPPQDPSWLRGAQLNIADACFQAPRDKVAILAGQEDDAKVQKWRYGDVQDLADRVSHGLFAAGLAAGDAVALYMPMTAECVAAYLGIVRAGMAVVSIPDSFAPPEVATRLALANCRTVITVASFRRGGKEVPMFGKAIEAGAQRCIVLADASPDNLRAVDLWWNEFLGPEDKSFPSVACDPRATSNILFSSGTTGEPKAIPWTHLTPIKAAMDGHFHQDIHPDDVVAWPTNIGWMMGPWLIYATFVNGATMALWEGAPTAGGFTDFLRRAQVTVLGVVPAIVRSWLGNGLPPHSLPDVRVFSSTGEASNAHDYLYLMSLAGYRAPIIEYCGGTEIGGGHITGTVVQPASPAVFTTPALGLDFRILGEDGQPTAAGEHGQLFLVPPSIGLSQRLLNRDHHAEYYAGVPTGPEGEVLRKHGDEVHVLHGGYWSAGGRADDTMNLGGIKVSSIELETAMNGHEAVVETAAVAVRPEAGGAANLVVFAVLANDASPDGLTAALQTRIKQRLNPLFRVHDVVVVEALPRTASNKVMRRELRRSYAAKD